MISRLVVAVLAMPLLLALGRVSPLWVCYKVHSHLYVLSSHQHLSPSLYHSSVTSAYAIRRLVGAVLATLLYRSQGYQP